jgi:hypothetical protein
MEKRDSYEQFFQLLSREKFLDFGMKNIITIDKEIVKDLWKKLLDRIDDKADDLVIRKKGDNVNENMKKLYKEIFKIDIKFDRRNNSTPTRLLETFTGYRINKTIFNYQVSHVYEYTKNVYCFAAPWNIVFIPRIIDPLTEHEAKGDCVNEFQGRFRKHIIEKFKEEIIEYNEIMKRMYPKIESWVDENIPKKNRRYYLPDFKEIEIL